jgi:hypothetical protein
MWNLPRYCLLVLFHFQIFFSLFLSFFYLLRYPTTMSVLKEQLNIKKYYIAEMDGARCHTASSRSAGGAGQKF